MSNSAVLGLVEGTNVTLTHVGGIWTINALPGGYPSLTARYVVTESTDAPPNAINLGALATGVLQQTVSGGVATVGVRTLNPDAIGYGQGDGRLTSSTSFTYSSFLGVLTVPALKLTGFGATGFLKHDNATHNIYLDTNTYLTGAITQAGNAGGASYSNPLLDFSSSFSVTSPGNTLVSLANTGVAAGTYQQATVTLNTKGQVTAATSVPMASMRIGFGAQAGTGQLDTNALALIDNSTPAFPKLIVSTVPVAAGEARGSFFAHGDGSGGAFDGTFMSHKNSTGSLPQFNTRRGRGTLTTPLAVSSNNAGQSDLLSQVAFTGGYSGANYLRGLGFFSWVLYNSTVDATHVPSSMALCNDGTINADGGGTMSPNGPVQYWSTAGDIVLGQWPTKLGTDTKGYVYLQTIGPNPTGVPVSPTTFGGLTTLAAPIAVEPFTGKFRSYFSRGFDPAAWHYAGFYDYDAANTTRIPFVGTAYTLTDSSSFTFDSGTNVLTAGSWSSAVTAVTPGSYTNTNLTVDAYGRITAASNGSGGGSGITALTGDVTASGSGSVAATLATVNSNVGSFTYGSFTVNAKGLITAASSGAAPEVPLTFSTGLNRTVNTVTANLSTGVAGGQSVIGGTASGDDLTHSSTSHSTKGRHIFGSTTGTVINEAWTSAASTPALWVGSPNTAAGSGLMASFGGTFAGFLRSALYNTSTGGASATAFELQQNAAQTGAVTRLWQLSSGYSTSGVLSANATILENVGGNLGIGAISTGSDVVLYGQGRAERLRIAYSTTIPSLTVINTGFVSFTSASTRRAQANGEVMAFAAVPPSQVAAAGSILDAYRFDAVTATFTTAVNITTAAGVNLIDVERPTYTNASAMAVTNGATVTIKGAPIAAGSLTLTNAYALWVQQGNIRFDSLATGVVKATSGVLSIDSSTYITSLTGDISGTGPGATATTLATVNSNVGTFTNATITVNAKGLITAASSGSAGGITGTLTSGQVPYATGTSAVASSSNFTWNNGTNQLSAPLLNTATVQSASDLTLSATGDLLASATGTLLLTAPAYWLTTLTSNGFVKTSGGTGALSIDTTSYLSTATAASTYQPILSATATRVFYSGGGSTISSNGQFTYSHSTGVNTGSLLTLGTNGVFGEGAAIRLNVEDTYISLTGGVKVGLYVANSYPQFAGIAADRGFFSNALVGWSAGIGLDDLYVGPGTGNRLYIGELDASGGLTGTDVIAVDSAGVGFFGTSPVGQQTVTGSRGGNAALASLLTKLASLGLIIDSTTP